jgi:hypothetical protein
VREGEGGTSRRACKRSSRMVSGSGWRWRDSMRGCVGGPRGWVRQTDSGEEPGLALRCVLLQIGPTVIVPGRGLSR